jgi:hypothetical protein
MMQSKASIAAIRFMDFLLPSFEMRLSLRIRLGRVIFKPFSRPFLRLQ